MKRRDFVKGASRSASAIALGTGAFGFLEGCRRRNRDGHGAGAGGGRRVHWRLASSFPRGLDTIFGAADTLAKRVAALTGDLFQIKVHAAGEIVPGLEVLDAVQAGGAEIGHTASYYFTGKNPSLVFDTCVPFGLTARQHNAWLLQGGGLELMRKVFADFNVLNFPGGNTGVQMGGWFRREINDAGDLNGLKMRIPGMGGQVMSRLGATVQVLAGGDIFPALERGAIDATEWVGPYDDEKLGFHKVAKLYYYPGFWEPGPALTTIVNRQAWDRLPKAYQQAFEVAALESSVQMLATYDFKNPPALRRLLEAGVVLKPFPKDVLSAARKATEGLLAEQAAKDQTFSKVFESWQSVRRDAFRWFATAELGYQQFAFENAP